MENVAKLGQLDSFEVVRGASTVEPFVGAGFFRVVGGDARTKRLFDRGSDGDAGQLGPDVETVRLDAGNRVAELGVDSGKQFRVGESPFGHEDVPFGDGSVSAWFPHRASRHGPLPLAIPVILVSGL